VFGWVRGRTSTPEEPSRFLAACPALDRDQFIVQVGTGLRSEEVLGPRAGRVDLSARRVEAVGVGYIAGRFGSGYKDRTKSEASIRAKLPELDSHGPHHTFATWLEDGGVPAWVVDELWAARPAAVGVRGSMIGTRCRHMTGAMQAREVTVVAERLAVALAVMPRCAPSPRQGRRRPAGAGGDTAMTLRFCGGGAEA
jgi:hypothetical protein